MPSIHVHRVVVLVPNEKRQPFVIIFFINSFFMLPLCELNEQQKIPGLGFVWLYVPVPYSTYTPYRRLLHMRQKNAAGNFIWLLLWMAIYI